MATGLTGRRVWLRPVEQADAGFLYNLTLDRELGPRWRTRGEILPPHVFLDRVWDDVTAQFIVCSTKMDGAPVGHVALYSMSLRDGHASIGVAMTQRLMRTGAGIEAFGLVAIYAIETYPLRKIYVEVPEKNLDLLGSILDRTGVKEARYTDHLYLEGVYQDLLVYSFDRASILSWLQYARK